MTAFHAHQEQIIATQTQHTAILRQIQHHLGILSTPEHAIPISPESAQAPHFVEQTMPPKEPTIGEAEAAEPRITISIIEYIGLCHTLQALATSQSILTQQITTLSAHQEQIITTQT